MIDVPQSFSQTFGSRQFGCFVDVVGTIFKGSMLGWQKAKLNFGVRMEYADYNQG